MFVKNISLILVSSLNCNPIPSAYSWSYRCVNYVSRTNLEISICSKSWWPDGIWPGALICQLEIRPTYIHHCNIRICSITASPTIFNDIKANRMAKYSLAGLSRRSGCTMLSNPPKSGFENLSKHSLCRCL